MSEAPGPDVARPGGAGLAPGPRPWGRRLAAHAALYLVVLVALLAVTDLDVGWTFDDGAYATQVAVLDQTGGWAYPYAHLDVDPGSDFAPVSHSTVTTEGSYPYVKQPLWIEVLRASTAVFGAVVGLYVPAVLGAVAAAALAGVLAARLSGGRDALVGFWAVALGPLVLHSEAMWAHTWAAALGAGMALALVALAQARARWWHLVGLAGGGALLCALRGEGPLVVVAAALVVGVLCLREGSWPRRLARAALWCGSLVVASAGSRLVTARWSARLAQGRVRDVGDTILGDVGFLEGRTRGALRTLLDGVGSDPGSTLLAMACAALAAVGGVLLVRGGPARATGARLVVVAVVVGLVRTVVVPDDLGGLLVAVPLVVVGAAGWRPGRASRAERALVALVVLDLGAVLATQYAEGGSRDWGGRYLFPVLVPATVVAVGVVRRALGRLPEVGPRRAGALVVALALVPTVGGWVASREVRQANDVHTELAASVDAPTVVRIPRYFTRTSWRELPAADWLSAEPDEADDALALLRPGRTAPVAVVGPGADQVRADGWARDVRTPQVVIFTPR